MARPSSYAMSLALAATAAAFGYLATLPAAPAPEASAEMREAWFVPDGCHIDVQHEFPVVCPEVTP